MIRIGPRFLLQRRTKFSRYIKAYEEKILKRISTYCAKSNEMNMCRLDLQKHVFYEEWFKCYIFFVYRFTQKFSNTLRPMAGGNFQSVFQQNYIKPNAMKLTYFFTCTKTCFTYRIIQNISFILQAVLRNDSKCIFNCTPWFLTLSNKVKLV